MRAARRALLVHTHSRRGEEEREGERREEDGGGGGGEEGGGACGRGRRREREEYARLMRRTNLVRYRKREGMRWKGGKMGERRGD